MTQSAGAAENTDSISAKECPRYDSKQSDSEASVMLELWGMRTIPSLPSLPGPIWSGVVASEGSILWVK